MKQQEDAVTLDMDDIFLYPDGTWKFAYEPSSVPARGKTMRVIKSGTPEYEEFIGRVQTNNGSICKT